MPKFALITAALLFIPSPIFAQITFADSSPTAAPAKPAKGKSDVDKVVCRTQDTLGSRLQAHQVCMTKSQWAAYEQQQRDEASGLQARTPAMSSR